MKLYKLTDKYGRTRGGTQWGPGVTHSAKGSADQELCSDGWIHAYEHPLIAVFMNPVHGNFANPLLWEAEGEIGKRQQLECGVRELTTVRAIEVPVLMTTQQRVKCGIGCAASICRDPKFLEWAANWVLGLDRSECSALALARWARAAVMAGELEQARARRAWRLAWAAWPAADKRAETQAEADAAEKEAWLESAWPAVRAAADTAVRAAETVVWAACAAVVAVAKEGADLRAALAAETATAAAQLELVSVIEWAISNSTELPQPQ